MTQHTAEQFANARFATHPDGRMAARVCTGPSANLYPWRCSDIPGRSDYAMAEDGFVPLSESLPSTVTDEMVDRLKRFMWDEFEIDLDPNEAAEAAQATLSAAPAPTTDEAHDIDWQAVAEYAEADVETVTRALDEARASAGLWKEAARRLLHDRQIEHGYRLIAKRAFKKAEKERDEARARAGQAMQDAMSILDRRTARQHLDAAWSAAHVPADGTIPEEAAYIRRYNDDGSLDADFSGSSYSLRADAEFGELRLLDPPTPKRPEGAEDWDEELGEMPAASDLTPEQRARLADALAERDHALGVRVTEDGEGER